MALNTRAALPNRLPAFFADSSMKPAKAKPVKVIIPADGFTYKIQFSTPTGRVKTEIATFMSKACNIILTDRWIVVGRRTFVPHGANVKIIRKV